MTRITLLALSIALAMPAYGQTVNDVDGATVSTKPATKGPMASRANTKALLAGAGSFTGAEPVMSPRFFRDGSNIEGEGCGTFSAGNFQYIEIPFNTDGTGSLTVNFDEGTCGTAQFVTFHDGAFNPGSICDNFHYDHGSSVSFTETFAVPANSPMVMVVSGVQNAPGVVCDFSYSIDGVGGTGVQLDNPASNNPVLIAEELIIPPPRTFTNNGSLDISTEVSYSFSPGEVRYARFHCPGMEFEAGTSVTYSGDPTNLIGAVNGIGSDAIYFSITAGATPVIAADSLVVDGDRTLTTKDPIDCTYGLYDFPSQAQAGGATGRVATTSGAYVRFGPSYALTVDAQGNPIANVESPDPAYSEFVVNAPTFSEFEGNVGGFSYGTTLDVLGTPQPITLDGNAIELVDLMDANTTLVFTGDFSTANDVYLGGSDCSLNLQSADSFDATSAVFTMGANDALGAFLCYEVSGNPIVATEVTVALAPVSADDTTYEVGTRGPLALGEITRNGTELQAPLAQIPGGWLSRLVLTNTGTQDRDYQIAVFGETGTTISTNNLTGIVEAQSTLVVDLDTVLTGFTGGLPRATLNVTVAAPNNTIQGLYQIVNPDSGSISNHVMVRPGSN